MAKPGADEFVVDFPTLWIGPDWIEQHCPLPDGDEAGGDLALYDWQLWCTVNHYRVKPTAQLGQLGPAFYHRRSQVIGPQKCGKGPWSATGICLEARGPALFAGWARGGEVYRCVDHDCWCGWEYEYQPGEPMGRRWATPLIQVLATSEAQVDNIWRPLQAMLRRGPLGEAMRVGETVIRGPDDSRIDAVTSSADSRLGNPTTYVVQDETGLYTATNKMRRTAETQRRGVAGMGGRSQETSNAPDPSTDNVAKSTWSSKRPDIFKFWRKPPSHLSYTNRAHRRRIHAYVYAGCKHIDLDSIEAEAAELIERDPGQAERFYGNRSVSGHSSWMNAQKWGRRKRRRDVPDKARIVFALDGSDVDDHTMIRAELVHPELHQFTPTFGPDKLPTHWDPAEYGGQVPRTEVKAAFGELMRRFDVVRVYVDPPYWETELSEWIGEYGEKRIIPWLTRRRVQMWAAAERLLIDVTKKDAVFRHDGCQIAEQHILNARKSIWGTKNEYGLVKATPAQKIDGCVTSILVHEAACDVIAAGLAEPKQNYIYTASTTRRG
ncbi:MAG: hypothetical protein ACRDS1_04175 [Pseudonocardiaceae bacterium]